MAEFTSAAEAPAARAVIYMMGFDHDMVQHALAQAGGNEQLAINLILNGEVHDVATASSSVASIASRAVSFSGPPFGFGTAFAPAKVASCSSSSSSSSSSAPPCALFLVATDFKKKIALIIVKSNGRDRIFLVQRVLLLHAVQRSRIHRSPHWQTRVT